MTEEKERVAIVGSGNWGSAIARIVGKNVCDHSEFEETVKMWVREEEVDGRKLSEIVNTTHENKKYLPGIKLPTNVVAEPDLSKAVEGCSILVLVVPHQFVENVCSELKKGNLDKRTKVISLVKGLNPKGGFTLFSEIIERMLEVDVSVLMGANVADEVARDQFCETTIASRDADQRRLLKLLFDRPTFRVQTSDDVLGTELCGALKNIVAVAAGICDGLHWGSNTKAAVVRIGLVEMRSFAERYYKGVKDETFFGSCGIGDLITSCYNGRNHRLAIAFVKEKKKFEDLEKEMLNGQKLQGPLTAKEVHDLLRQKGDEGMFPLFSNVHKICSGHLDPNQLLQGL